MRKNIPLLVTVFMMGTALFTIPLKGQEQQGWKASPETVSSLTKSRPEFNYYEEKVPAYTLPDVLTTSEGCRITRKWKWEKLRRPELVELFTSQVYGRMPGTPWQEDFKVVRVDPNAMEGAATLKLVDIVISYGGKFLTIHLGLFVPNRIPKPVPAFLLICNRPVENIDFTREKKSEFWPAEEVVARGYAVAAFYNADVDPDEDDGFRNGIHGLLDTGRNEESWGTIAAWAWGAGRCMDYLVRDSEIDREKVALVGHSRGGKTALWAGATDERFALIIPNEAGCGGTSIARRRYGETISRINKSFPHWFCGNYKKYGDNEEAFPVDMHMLMALIAPRALYVASAGEDLWADPRGQYLALYHSLPVYRLYNKKTALPETMPLLNTPVSSGPVAYHIRDGVHNLLLQDWNCFMNFADVVFKQISEKSFFPHKYPENPGLSPD